MHTVLTSSVEPFDERLLINNHRSENTFSLDQKQIIFKMQQCWPQKLGWKQVHTPESIPFLFEIFPTSNYCFLMQQCTMEPVMNHLSQWLKPLDRGILMVFISYHTLSHKSPLGSKGLKRRQCTSPPSFVLNFLFGRIGIDKDQTLDHLVIEALIPCHKSSLPIA